MSERDDAIIFFSRCRLPLEVTVVTWGSILTSTTPLYSRSCTRHNSAFATNDALAVLPLSPFLAFFFFFFFFVFFWLAEAGVAFGSSLLPSSCFSQLLGQFFFMNIALDLHSPPFAHEWQ